MCIVNSLILVVAVGLTTTWGGRGPTSSFFVTAHAHINNRPPPDWFPKQDEPKRSHILQSTLEKHFSAEVIRQELCSHVELPKEREMYETTRSLSQRLAKFVSETENMALCSIEPMAGICKGFILHYNTFSHGEVVHSFNSTVHTQAAGKACPWHWELRNRSNMYPHLRAVAVCSSNNCSLDQECLIKGISRNNPNATSHGCQQVFSLMPVLKKEKRVAAREGGETKTTERWDFYLEEVPVSCSCQVGPATEVKK